MTDEERISLAKKLNATQGVISEYYRRAENDYGKAGKMYASDTGLDYKAWHDLVIQRNDMQERLGASAGALSKAVAKEEQTKANWQSWAIVSAALNNLNNLPQEELIVKYQSIFNPNSRYTIIDKKNTRMVTYDGGRKVLDINISLGGNKSDAQTVTKVSTKDGGRVTQEDVNKRNYKVDWEAGNYSTGAGRYYVSVVDPRGYMGNTIVNMMNEAQFERFKKTGIIENVGTSIHFGTQKEDGRGSHGCINVNHTDLRCVGRMMAPGEEIFILPEDEGNAFKVAGGKLILDVSGKHNYNEYIDKRGNKQKGQGINRSVNSLAYEPIQLNIDEHEAIGLGASYRTNKTVLAPFVSELVTRKRDIMQAAKINSDVYNDIALMSVGVLGVESTFGKKNSLLMNIAKGIRKVFDRSKASSDYFFEMTAAKLGIVDMENSSLGLTQLRWSFLSDSEKTALSKLGITSPSQLTDPKKAAVATAAVLGVRYNEQLTKEQKQNIWMSLPAKWNSSANYNKRVINHAIAAELLANAHWLNRV